MSIDVNKTYSISGQTLYNLASAIKNMTSLSTVDIDTLSQDYCGSVQGHLWSEILSSGAEPAYISDGFDYALDLIADPPEVKEKAVKDDQGQVLFTEHIINDFIWDQNLIYYPTIRTTGIDTCCGMFANCKNLVYVDDIDLSDVSCTSNMFSGCLNLKTINIDWTKTGNVETMAGMFSGCKSLVDFPEDINTDNCTNFSNMFTGCKNLKNIQFLDTDGSDISNMFAGCYSLTLEDINIILEMCSVANSPVSGKMLTEVIGKLNNYPCLIGGGTTPEDKIENMDNYQLFEQNGWTIS